MDGPDALISGYCETLARRELMHTGKVRHSVQDVGGAVKHRSCHKSLGTPHGDSCGVSEQQVLGAYTSSKFTLEVFTPRPRVMTEYM